MIKQILFDFDGTIVDSMGLALQILNAMAEKHHYKKVTMEDVHTLKKMPVTERFKKIGLPLYKLPGMSVECMAMYRHRIHVLNPFDGIRELALFLKKDGYGLSVLSSNSVENIAEFLKRNDLEIFDHIFSSNNLFGKDKSIKRFIGQFGLRTDELVYVGDELRDIEACKKTAVKVVAVTWGFDPLSLLKSGGPDYIANTPEDIVAAIKNIQAGDRIDKKASIIS